ncbi:MAG: cardiolipin synthase, partial [Bacteroidaceae bacterium]|nr:cardiolipin synthase [Bacteroidaceae bacterium]
MTAIARHYIKLIFAIPLVFYSINLNANTQEKNITTNISSDSTLIAYLQEYGITTTTNNELKILKSGKEKFLDLFEEIEKAQHHIHLEYFNFRNDSIANTLFELLEKKAHQGVEVRAMFDAFGNSSNNQPLKKEHIEAIREKGIEIVKFDPLTFPWINHAFHRDHRKIAIIDGKIGYTGGMNIADYYINGLPEIGEWRDMHIRIEGEAVGTLQDIFLDMWNKATDQHIDGECYYP